MCDYKGIYTRIVLRILVLFHNESGNQKENENNLREYFKFDNFLVSVYYTVLCQFRL